MIKCFLKMEIIFTVVKEAFYIIIYAVYLSHTQECSLKKVCETY